MHREKTDEPAIATIAVEADLCPQALLRILGLIAQLAAVPLSVTAARGRTRQRIVVEIDTLPAARVDVVAAKIDAIVSVRSVSLRWRRKAS